MNAPRATAEDYIAFLVATPSEGTAAEMGRCQPVRPGAPAHDAFTRLLNRPEPDPEALWAEGRPLLPPDGVLVFDDAVLDKPFARHMGLVGRFRSGRHGRVVQGINLVTAVWTDGDGLWPRGYRLVDESAGDGTKNDHLRGMLATAAARGWRPRCVCSDAWYPGPDDLKAVRGRGWVFLAQVRSNRRVNPDRAGNRAIEACDIAATGTVVHLEGYGLVQAFRIVATNGDTGHGVTSDLGMDDLGRVAGAERAWAVEEYHRGLKPYTEVDRCQARLARSQASHAGLAVRAFVRLEYHRYTTGVSWFQAKCRVVRDAVRAYLANPAIRLPQGATA